MAKNQNRINVYFGRRSVEDQMLWEYLMENHGEDMAAWLKYYARMGIMNAHKAGRARPASSGAPGLLMKPQPITPSQPQKEEEHSSEPVVVEVRERASSIDVLNADEAAVVKMPTVEEIPSSPASSFIQAENAEAAEPAVQEVQKETKDALDVLNHLDDIVVDNVAKNHEQKLSRFIPVEDDEDVLGLIKGERGR